MNGTRKLAECLQQLRAFFDKRSWKYCLIGGLAAVRWGEMRLTRDVDIVVYTIVGEEESLINEMLAEFRPRIDQPKEFALTNRVLLLNSESGIPIDVSLGALVFEERMIANAKQQEILPDQWLPVARPEDVIVMKTLAGRPRDWQDIAGIIAKQLQKLDWAHIETQLIPLLEVVEHPERVSLLRELKERVKLNIQNRNK